MPEVHSVYQGFANTAKAYPDHPFLQIVADTAQRYEQVAETHSYAQISADIDRVAGIYAHLLTEEGWPAGERVGLDLENRVEMFVHWLALNALGVSVVPINPQWRTGELEYVFEHSELRVVVCLADRQTLHRHAARSVSSSVAIHALAEFNALDALAQWEFVADSQTECALLYTSGTTGQPKGCVLSNEYFLVAGTWYRDVGGLCKLDPGKERLLTPLPMYHMNAMATSTMAMILTGGCVIPLDRFHPTTFWNSVEESQPTILHYLGVMPVMLMGMAESEQDNAHTIRFGFGAGLSGELHNRFETRFGFKLIEAWAMTETGCSVAIIASKEPRHVGTACFGVPGDHIDYRLVDDAGRDVPDGQPGELLVRRQGDQPRYGFFSGYLKNDTATAEAWAGGYFHTGDLVWRDTQGALHFVDRKKNLIRRSGENIAAVEVEQVLLEHDDIASVAVTAVADEVRGDEVFACVVPTEEIDDPSSTAESIVEHCLSRLAYYKAPGYVGFCDELPLTATEKLARSELKHRARTMMDNHLCIDTRSMKSGSKRASQQQV